MAVITELEVTRNLPKGSLSISDMDLSWDWHSVDYAAQAIINAGCKEDFATQADVIRHGIQILGMAYKIDKTVASSDLSAAQAKPKITCRPKGML